MWSFVLFFSLILLVTSEVCAQRFEETDTSSANKAWIKSSDKHAISVKNAKEDVSESEKTENKVAKENFLPDNKTEDGVRPTLDGSVRGRTSVRALVPAKDGEPEEQYILLYMEKFTMEQIYEGTPSCSMRFVVLTNLDKKVSQFAVKLVWPQIATTLSFIDIRPNTRTYYDYTLLGEGCYTMDVEPNIIVNRCRIKGVSAKDCANKIRWLKDAK